MPKERTARKRGHKSEAREHRADPLAEGLELPNHPNFDEASEQTMPVSADTERTGHLVRSPEDPPG
jgi:hypothetical protein